VPTVDEKPFCGRMKAIQVQLTLSDDCLNEAHGRFELNSFVKAPGVKIQNSGFAAPSAASRLLIFESLGVSFGLCDGHTPLPLSCYSTLLAEGGAP
jgi:hypothetical protein